MITRFWNVLLITVLVTACSSTGNKQSLGALLGGAAGALVGAKVSKDSNRAASVAIGTAVGALVGYGVGRYLDDQDQQHLAAATVKTAESGQTQEVRNSETGTTIRTAPVSSPSQASSEGCRTVKQSVELADGRHESENVRLCKGPNGWEAA
jgi:surface antigen